MNILKLTPLEFDIWQHRFDVPCAICDALEYCYDDEKDEYVNWYSSEKVYAAIDLIKADEKKYTVTYPDGQIYLDVINDCVTGTTYLCLAADAVGDEISHQKHQSIMRAYDRLEAKVDKLLE